MQEIPVRLVSMDERQFGSLKLTEDDFHLLHNYHPSRPSMR